METKQYTIYAILTLFGTAVAMMIKILPESQRFALFKMGIFVKFVGPGPVFTLELSVYKYIRISVGAVGELVDSGSGRFQDSKGRFFDLPVEMGDSTQVGNLIRITGFTEDKARSIQNPEQRKTIQCEKCGHHDCYGGKDCFELHDASLSAYRDPETLALTRTATALESRYYNRLTRVEEVMRFAEEMGWRHLGIAFCIGLAGRRTGGIMDVHTPGGLTIMDGI